MWLQSLQPGCGEPGGERNGKNSYYIVFGNEQDHDHASLSSKSSGVSQKAKATRKLSSSKSLEAPRTKSSEPLTSPKKTGYGDQSNKPANMSREVTDEATLHNLNSPIPAPSIKKSSTISNGPAPRHRTTLGRTSARKNLSMESIDLPVEDEDEIERLEAARAELQTQIADEVRANAKLQSQVENQKRALDERRLALEQNIARLQELLHKEKNCRAALENKTELEELALVEADLAYLERKVEELGKRLNSQIDRNLVTPDFSSQPRQMSNQERRLKYKADTEVAATSQSDRSISKGTVTAQQDSHIVGVESDGERKAESTPLPNKHPPTSSKRSALKGEVARNQIASELQNMEKGRDSSRSSHNVEKGKGSERHQSLASPHKFGGSEAQSVPNPEKGKGTESSDKGSTKGKSSQPSSSEKLKKSDSHPAHHTDGWNQQPKHLERGKSEGHQTYNVDKGR
ncbi:unnamed protein product [Sphenostylis stenocarpa]|uniref:Uncharacterized protein n=1 Tax=Sphenostylis stenocarpa TaxID=92480 RepID=A0AA86TH68_9FABA|nr:unnamed protein product [Sphenostylis stenocarpa]